MSQAHLERLLAVAVTRRGLAIAGARDPGPGPSRFHVLPSRGKATSFDADAAVHALAAQGGWVLAGTAAGAAPGMNMPPAISASQPRATANAYAASRAISNRGYVQAARRHLPARAGSLKARAP